MTKVPIINQHEKPRETTIPAQTPREFVHGNNMAAKKKPSRGPPMRPAMVLISWWSKPVSFDISIAKPNSTMANPITAILDKRSCVLPDSGLHENGLTKSSIKTADNALNPEEILLNAALTRHANIKPGSPGVPLRTS